MGRMKDVLIYVENRDFIGLAKEYGVRVALWAFASALPKGRLKAVVRKCLGR